MDVLKDFELRQVGSRLVLRQICPPDFEMRTVIAADKIVEQKEDFFVLGYNEKFFCLCRYDKQNRCLCSKIGCDDYVRLGKKILFLQNMMWQLWDEDFQLHFLHVVFRVDIICELENHSDFWIVDFFVFRGDQIGTHANELVIGARHHVLLFADRGSDIAVDNVYA